MSPATTRSLLACIHERRRHDVDKNEMVKGFSQNDAVVILKTNGGTIQGYLSKIDLAQDCFVIQVAVYIGLDGKVERLGVGAAAQ